jgi:pantoate--beta-alanine ligase
MVVQRLLSLMGLPTVLHRCPIIREADGLAMSSRNLRLNAPQRANATAIYRALSGIKAGFGAQPVPVLVENAIRILEAADFRVDYISIADATTLEPLPGPSPSGAVALIAAFLGDVRLIDNMVLGEPTPH